MLHLRSSLPGKVPDENIETIKETSSAKHHLPMDSYISTRRKTISRGAQLGAPLKVGSYKSFEGSTVFIALMVQKLEN